MIPIKLIIDHQRSLQECKEAVGRILSLQAMAGRPSLTTTAEQEELIMNAYDQVFREAQQPNPVRNPENIVIFYDVWRIMVLDQAFDDGNGKLTTQAVFKVLEDSLSNLHRK